MYAFAASCDLTKPLAFVNVVAANRTTFAGTPGVLPALDQAGALAGSVAIPSVAPRAALMLAIPLRKVGTSLRSERSSAPI